MQEEDKIKIQEAETEIRTLMTEYSAELELLSDKKKKIIRDVIQQAENRKLEKIRDKINKP